MTPLKPALRLSCKIRFYTSMKKKKKKKEEKTINSNPLECSEETKKPLANLIFKMLLILTK